MSTKQNKLGAALTRARKLKGKNRADIKEALGVSGTTVGNWEQDVHPPGPDKWQLIREVYGVDPAEYLLAEENNSATVIGDLSTGVQRVDNGGYIVQEFSSGEQKTKGHHVVTLDDFEHDLLMKFRKYGNRTMGERCLQKLQAIAAMVG